MMSLAERVEYVRHSILKASERGKKQKVTLVAVTKTVLPDQIEQAIRLGVKTFGENRVQEAVPKTEQFPQAEWHFIGALQTNKVKDVVGRFALIHSVDRLRLAMALQEEAEKRGLVVPVLLQINIGRESQKGGLDPQQTEDFLREAVKLPRLRFEGLMAIAPQCDNPDDCRPYFREMYRLFTGLSIPGVQMKTLSMGMSGDYQVAVEEGANLVRVGSLLFGERT